MPYGIRGLYLINELFIAKNDNFRNKYEFQAVYSHFISKLNMALDSPYMKAYKANFIQGSTLLSQKDMYMNTFQPADGDHIRFLNFHALSAIFELGIQQIWIQHPSMPLKTYMP